MNSNIQTNRANTLDSNELENLHADDLHAAHIVVGLMSGVFFLGLLMYAFIFWLVM